MNPQVKIGEYENNVFHCTISNILLPFANAIRRTILSNIPVIGFYTEKYKNNKCNIEVNTSRLHNEILKHRLSCIPVHKKILNESDESIDEFCKNYILEVDVKNTTDQVIYVTTADFRVKHRESGRYVAKDEVSQWFKANPKSGDHPIFARLRPKLGSGVEGEQIKLTCEFAKLDGTVSGVYTSACLCVCTNTKDDAKAAVMKGEMKSKMEGEGEDKETIEYALKNFDLLDAYRYGVPNSYDFRVESVGVYENEEMMKYACVYLQNKFVDLYSKVDAGDIPIILSEVGVDKNMYDVVFEGEDYTVGNIINDLIYKKYIEESELKKVTFTAFKKLHPHDESSVLRVAVVDSHPVEYIKSILKDVMMEAQEVYKKVYRQFK